MTTNRYYESNSENEIRPGRISNELREALNIAENDIPIWIYRMRALGYPPGWLSKAVVDTNDIFDTDSPDESSDSKKRKSPPSEVQYDLSKLIDYPGFNSPMPINCVDYHYYINMPPLLAHQQLDYAKKHMSSFKPAQFPKRIKSSNDSNAAEVSVESINESTVSEPIPKTKETDGPDSPEADRSKTDTTNADTSEIENPQLRRAQTESDLSIGSGFKLVSKGSPMPKPIDRLPLEKFSEGVVGELLYFENTPTSSGKFDSIRGLLNTIRKSKSETSFQEDQTNL